MSLDHWLAYNWSCTAYSWSASFLNVLACGSSGFKKVCVAVFYIVCTCTVNSCRASLQYDGQASLNYQWNKCNQCNYAWSDPSAFRPHLITHNGEKSKNVNNVTLHLIACSVWGIIWKHTVEKKSNKCIQCDFASSDASNLRKHLKRHIGEKFKGNSQFAGFWEGPVKNTCEAVVQNWEHEENVV